MNRCRVEHSPVCVSPQRKVRERAEAVSYLKNKIKQAEEALSEARAKLVRTQPASVQPGHPYAEVRLRAMVIEVVCTHARV